MATIDELTTPLTTDEVKASIYSVLEMTGVTTTAWKPGSVVRAIITACAIVIAALSQLVALIAKSGFLEYAEGAWLTLKAYHDFGVDRIKASAASGNVVLDNTGGGSYSLGVGELTVVNSTTGKAYRNTAAFTLDPLETGVLVPVAAVEAGSASTAIAGEIDTLETALLGVTVTNTEALIGVDAEEDPALKTRCGAKLGALSPNGPRDAYSFVATGGADRLNGTKSGTRADGTAIGVNRTRVVNDDGVVSVYIATPSGAVAASDVAIIDDDVQQLCTPIGVTSDVISATPIAIDVTYEIWLYDTLSLDDDTVADAVSDELTAFIAAEQIGGNIIDANPGKVFVSAIEAAIGRTHYGETHLRIFRVSVTEPAADVELLASHVPTLGTLTVAAIHQIAKPD